MSEPFRYLLRVRYGECDAQGIVFNARWGEYIDLASSEYTRHLFGSVDPATAGVDWRLVKQTMEWRSPAKFDDVLDLRVRTLTIGTTSYTSTTEVRRYADATPLATCETVYVSVDLKTGVKLPIPAHIRAALERGADGIVIDHAAALR